MLRFKYVLSEVLTGLWRNVLMTVAMIITMTISLTMLGSSLLVYRWVDDMRQFYYDKVEVSIFLDNEITDQQRLELQGSLSGDPLIRTVTFESKEQAYARFKQMYRTSPDLLEATTPTALPASFRIKLKDPKQYKAVSNKYRNRPGVDDIIDQQELLKKVFGVFGAVQLIVLVFAILMGVAALALVANTIQIAAYSKRREVAVMKLVGASNWFIQMPFVLEAVFAGLIGALLAFFAMCGFQVFMHKGSLKVLAAIIPSMPWSYVFVLLPTLAGIAAAVSALTGWITLRFYVRV